MQTDSHSFDQKRSGLTTVDRWLRAIVAKATAAGSPVPTRVLSPFRAAASRQVVNRHAARGAEIATRIAAGDGEARGELAELADLALAEMRQQVLARCRGAGALPGLIASGDARWGDCDEDELLDDPELDAKLRRSIMTSLDTFNGILGNYDRFFDTLLPLARPSGTTRVLDLAAGHGGFACAATRIAKQRGLEFHFTVSDLKREYLDIGEADARREGLDIDFVVQDALDLSNLAPDSYDIIVCTQSLHHFPPGLVTVMFEAACRAASRGVVFIDGCRSALSAAMVLTVGNIRLRDKGWVHDGWISTRKCFVPEELELLARLARSDHRLEAAWMQPAHCLLRWTAP